MKPLLLLFFVFGMSFKCFSQTQVNADSLVEQICITLKTDKLSPDSLAIQHSFEKHFYFYANSMDKQDFDSILYKCFIRLSKSCLEFAAISLRTMPQKGDWALVDKEPASMLSVSDCRNFFKVLNFEYLESTGDKVKVTMTDSSWTDTFTDSTFSHLSLQKISPAVFELTFKESNNITRKNLSNTDDKYRYKILEKHDNYYLMYLGAPQSEIKWIFKLYFNGNQKLHSK